MGLSVWSWVYARNGIGECTCYERQWDVVVVSSEAGQWRHGDAILEGGIAELDWLEES